MAEGQDASQNIITVTVKAPKQKENIEIGENADIKEVHDIRIHIQTVSGWVRERHPRTHTYTEAGGIGNEMGSCPMWLMINVINVCRIKTYFIISKCFFREYVRELLEHIFLLELGST